MLDIRIPMGLLFTLVGALLVIYGVSSDAPAVTLYGVNINTGWGGVLLGFGLAMLLLARRRVARLRRAS
jgi:hypothetical protein